VGAGRTRNETDSVNSRTGFTPSRQRPVQPDQQQGDVDECCSAS
jgi:hypothetical protein